MSYKKLSKVIDKLQENHKAKGDKSYPALFLKYQKEFESLARYQLEVIDINNKLLVSFDITKDIVNLLQKENGNQLLKVKNELVDKIATKYSYKKNIKSIKIKRKRN